jgi:hypothetical protein
LFFLVLAFFLSASLMPPGGTVSAQNPRLQSEAPRYNKRASMIGGCCDQKTWAQKSTSGPSPRTTALAYDQARQKTVLFGGYTQTGGGMDNQTWLWNGSTWTLTSPAMKPTARRSHNLAYDSQQQVTVLFGGQDITNNLKADTWEWNGTNWTPRAVTGAIPMARQNHAMAYDSVRGVTVLFGGEKTTGYLSDTWEWNSSAGTWTLKSSAGGPNPRSYASMAYDPVRNVTVLFGGGNNSGQQSDTWEWNGTNWSQKFPGSSPPARAGHGMAYDGSCGVVMFGGRSTNAGTYLATVSNWFHL